jgi:hypothetical protein
MTVPDWLLWTKLFAPLGAHLLPASKSPKKAYLRPFVAGSIPYLLSTPVLFLGLRLTVEKTAIFVMAK